MADGTENGDGRAKKGTGALGDLVKAESMLQLALAVPGGCLIGWLLGTYLDRHFHQDWMAVAGVVLGAIGGFVQIFRMASGYLKRSS
jgi:ATP synthase protein I